GGDALAQRGLGRSVQRRTVPINKVRFAGIYKEPLRGTLNRPPPSAPSAQTPLLTKEGTEACSLRPLPAKVGRCCPLFSKIVSKKLKLTALLHKKHKRTNHGSLFCAFCG